MKFSNLMYGGSYHIKTLTGTKYEYIFISLVDNNIKYRINVLNGTYESDKSYFRDGYDWEIREATSEEEEWLYKCISEDKFIPRNQIIKKGEVYEIF